MINNDITEDKVGFEVSKLLREKGFKNSNVENFWLMYLDGRQVGEEFLDKSFDNSITPTLIHLKSPTHSLAIKWIRENFNYNVEVTYRNADKNYQAISHPIFPNTEIGLCGHYKSPDEATEAALLYTLKNLIP